MIVGAVRCALTSLPTLNVHFHEAPRRSPVNVL